MTLICINEHNVYWEVEVVEDHGDIVLRVLNTKMNLVAELTLIEKGAEDLVFELQDAIEKVKAPDE